MSLFDLLKTLEEKFTVKKEATISGISFEIALLTYEQDQMVSALPEEGMDPLTYYEKTRLHILSYAVIKINGEEFPKIIETIEDGKTVTKEKAIYVRDILKSIPQKVVEKLFEVYVDLRDEADTKIDGEVEYKWYKTPEQRKSERDKSEKEAAEKEAAETAKDPSIPDAPIDQGDQPIVFTKIEEKDEEPPLEV